jgi:hypothetical protein
MKTTAATVEAYLQELPPERRDALTAVREVILKNLDPQYEEGIQYGMIGYYVPHSVYPKGYFCDPKQPLPLAALASQKSYMALHLMFVYTAGAEDAPPNPHAEWFLNAWSKTGKKLDMGKACLRFKRLDDLALDVIGEAFRRVPASSYIEHFETLAARRKRR